MHRMQVNKGKTNYHPNSLGGGCPFQAMMKEGGFTSFEERVEASKVRKRSKSFFDHFSQATLFYNSLSSHEQRHLRNAFSFELGKVKAVPVRQRMVDMLLEVDKNLAQMVSDSLGLVPQKLPQPISDSIPADADPKEYNSFSNELPILKSPALSMAGKLPDHIKARRIAILTADGVEDATFTQIKQQLCEHDAVVKIIAPKQGFVMTGNGDEYPVDESFLTASSVMFDAVFIAGESAQTLSGNADALHFVAEAYKHCKPLASQPDGEVFFKRALPEISLPAQGINTSGKVAEFMEDIKQHRFWEREEHPVVPA